MAIPAKQLEIERLVNMARAFGWELLESKIGEAVLTVTLTKKLPPEMMAGGGGTSPA